MNISEQSLPETTKPENESSLSVSAQESRDRRWTISGGTSSRSFELESWSYVQHKDYQLQLLQKVTYTLLDFLICKKLHSVSFAHVACSDGTYQGAVLCTVWFPYS